MLEFLIYYLFIAVLFSFVLTHTVDQSLQYEYDNEIIELFSDKRIKYVSISLLSFFWIITIFVMTYVGWRGRNE